MCAGIREDGSVIEKNDPVWDDLHTVAKTAKERPESWLKQDRIYGDLANSAAFSDAFCRWLPMIWEKGCDAALREYAEGARKE
jgi:mannitol 2-dehydrogenase